MRDEKRIPQILAELQKIWEKYPDLRLGQLLCNVYSDPALYYKEDEDLIEGLKKFYFK
jgi:uncharacterized protein YihD (DUF1040 family)